MFRCVTPRWLDIERSKFPLSPRIEALKRIRAKLKSEQPPAGAADDGASKRKPRR